LRVKSQFFTNLKGFFKKFDDEVEIGRIFADNPKTVSKNYLKNPDRNLDNNNVSKYVKKVAATKTLYNKMDMRSTFIGQQLQTDFNRCFKNKQIVLLIEKRKKQSLQLKKNKEVVKALPKKVYKINCTQTWIKTDPKNYGSL